MKSLADQRIATGKDFDDDTGKLKSGSKALVLDNAAVTALRGRLEGADEWRIDSVETRAAKRQPSPAFTTSTLQQEAGRKLRLSARDTMRVAQTLYERGLITYHRTDSVNLSDEAIDAARARVKSSYGADYLSPKPRRYKTGAKSAQEAHEAIRPAGTEMRPAAELTLDGREARLYDLIWKRTMATQMAEARLEFVTADITVLDAVFRANGRRVVFPGFFRAYVEGSDDPDAAIEDRDAPLPELVEGELLDLREIETVGHETKPPSRFTEAALVKALEAAGVGRPSTYASIISTIQDRGYVRKEGTALTPTFTAFAVTGLLESDFEQLVDIGFTAGMEEDLDRIAAGDFDWQKYLGKFFLGDQGLSAMVDVAGENIDPRAASTVELGDIEVRVGRYGPFIEHMVDGERTIVAIPDDLAPGDLSSELVKELIARSVEGPSTLGEDPKTGVSIFLKDGPFGPYVQLGEDGTGDDKPKRVSLPKGMQPTDVNHDIAVSLLALPRDLGPHPDDQKSVKAGIGRYGPYVLHDGTYASLGKEDDVLDIDLARGVELLTAKRERRGKGAGQTVLKELGTHPESGEEINILDGRYGPYVKHGKINASLKKGTEPDSVTLEEALELLAAKESAPKRKRRTKKAAE